MTEPPVPFVLGMPRSGTTLLRLMLDSHPELAIPPETDLVPRVLAADPSPAGFLEAATGHWRWPDLGLDEQLLERRLEAIAPFDLGEAVRTVYRTYAERFGKRRFGDKSPSHRWHMRAVAELLPEAHFVHLIRDGRDVALSLVSVWFGPDTIVRAAERWRDDVAEARTTGAQLPHYAEARFEDLVLETEPTLRKLCEFLELPWTPDLLDYHERAGGRLSELTSDALDARGQVVASAEERRAMHAQTTSPPRADRVGRWRRELSPEDRRQFESVAGELLAELGYEVQDPGWSD